MANLTPKAIIHQRFGDQARYEIQEVEDEDSKVFPGLSVSQKKPTLFRCVLGLPSLSVTSDTFKRKRDAEQSAAQIAILTLGIDLNLNPTHLSQEQALISLSNRVHYILSNEFLSSDHPLTFHIRCSLSHSQFPSLSSSVLAALDHKAASLCKLLNPDSPFDPTLSANLVLQASANHPNLSVSKRHRFVIQNTSPCHHPIRKHDSIFETTLVEAVFIPCSSLQEPRTITLTLSPNEYHLDSIARNLGELDSFRLILSRSIGSSSSDVRLYFVGDECLNVNLNLNASYLSGQRIYGDSVMANVGYHWKSDDLFFGNLSLQMYYRMVIKRTPTGNYKLSRNAILGSSLPRVYTSRSLWRGSPPKELLFSFCRQQRFSDPEIACEPLRFQCSIGIFSKANILCVKCCQEGLHVKQADAVNFTSLVLLNWLNIFFDHPDPVDTMKESADSLGITFDPDVFSSFISSPNKPKTSSPLSLSSPNGSVASVSYTASLVSNGQTEVIEEVEELEFEIGTGSVIPPIEDAVSHLSISQSTSFLADPPPAEILLSASKTPESTIKLITDSCKILYNVKLVSLTEPPEERMEKSLFNPPLSKQRLQYATEIIEGEKIASLIDFGCGSGSLLDSIVEHSRTIERLAGVDVSQRALVKAAKSLHSKVNEESRVKSVILYELSILTRDGRLRGFEMGTCVEVIEHMMEEEAWEFGRAALGYFRPRILLVSTPNYEFNAVLRRGPEEEDDKMQFRNHDHKFEWTREQFQRWGNALADQFGYRVAFGGVGVSDGVHLGFASQIAVFYRLSPVDEPVAEEREKEVEIEEEKTGVLWAWEARR